MCQRPEILHAKVNDSNVSITDTQETERMCQTASRLPLAQPRPSFSLDFYVAQHADRCSVDLGIRSPLERALLSSAVATAPWRRASAYERGHTPSTMPALAPSYQQLGQRNNYQIPLEQLNIV